MRGWWSKRPPRVRFATITLVVMGLCWPVVVVLMVLGLPIFEQVMIALSFIAPILTAIDILFTSEVHEQTGGD